MSGRAALAGLMRRAWEAWDPAVEIVVFGTDDAEEIASAICADVAQHLGPVEDAIFYKPGVGMVAGLLLTDGRRVVVKVHRWNVTVERLARVHDVQAHMATAGLPAPRPLAPAHRLAGGIATAEHYQPGARGPGDRRLLSRLLATGLHDFVTTGRAFRGDLSAIGHPVMLRGAGEPLWWEPHDVRFDFDRTRAGAEWIDDLASVARRRLQRRSGEAVIGHFDWRVENLGFRDDRIVGIYDWDSLAVAPEPVLVGNTAAQFPIDWTRHEPDPLPSLDEMRTFVEDYERARGAAFTGEELEMVDAANLAICAYGARCQHSDMSLHPEVGGLPTTHWERALRERGDSGLLQ